MIEHHGPEFDPRTESMREQRQPDWRGADDYPQRQPRPIAQAGQNRVEAIIAKLGGMTHQASEAARWLEAQADAVLGCSPKADESEPGALVPAEGPLFDRLDMVVTALDHAMRRLKVQVGRNCWALPNEPADRSDPLAQRGWEGGL